MGVDGVSALPRSGVGRDAATVSAVQEWILLHTGKNLNAEVFSPGPSVLFLLMALPVVAVVFNAINQRWLGSGLRQWLGGWLY
jgi:hypothetical protein